MSRKVLLSEKVTRRDFQEQYLLFAKSIEGLDDEHQRSPMAFFLLHRIVLLFFLQAQGLLDNNKAYLSSLLQKSHALVGPNCFYSSLLWPLLRYILNHIDSEMEELRPLGQLLSFNTNLLAPSNELSQLARLEIPDQSFQLLFSFLNAYQWSLQENVPADQSALTPGILSTIFELCWQEDELGAYYTPADITHYVSQHTILPCICERWFRSQPELAGPSSPLLSSLHANIDRYLPPFLRDPQFSLDESAYDYQQRKQLAINLKASLLATQALEIDAFITHGLDLESLLLDGITNHLSAQQLLSLWHTIRHLTILDPTCGTGAFLFAALYSLEPIAVSCVQRLLELDNSPQTDEIRQMLTTFPNIPFAVRYWLIHDTLYGVDLSPQATDLCRIRLLISLLEYMPPLASFPSLPTIQTHIRTANALTSDIHSATQDQREFVWWQAFPEVAKENGFAVVLGNPPYVEYNAENFSYRLPWYQTLICGNLYPCVVERSRQLLAPDGWQGMILPLAAFTTRNMRPFVLQFRQWFPRSWVSFYHFRPAMLFAGGKKASLPTSIFIANASGSEQNYSTRLLKWKGEERTTLFSRLHYTKSAIQDDCHSHAYYPKLGSTLEQNLLESILRHPPIQTYLTSKSSNNAMYYRSAGGLYWKVFINFPWPYQTTSNKVCSFQAGYEADLFVALFNSSLFWWYYTISFDSFNLKDYILFGFRFPYPEDQQICADLRFLCSLLMEDYRFHAEHKQRGSNNCYTIYARKSQPIIHAIDRVLGRLYNLNTDEIDFLIHYDLHYRLGGKEAL